MSGLCIFILILCRFYVVTSSASTDTFSKASNTTLPVVAPPKFVFGSGMSERIKKSVDDESDTSDKEEEPSESGIDFLDYASAALKRSADSDDDAGDFSCADLFYVPKKILKIESPETRGANVLRPSALSAIANKLTKQHADGENDENVEHDKSAKTHGETSSSTNSSDSLTSLSRPHLIDTPAPLNTGVQSENYFQQFILGNSALSESKGSFVFGQNIRERVDVESSSNDAEDASCKVSKKADRPKSLAELADKGSTSSVETEISQNSIAAAAQKYESEHSPPKQNLAEVHVMTGEEDERNVVQVNCRLFIYSTETHSWLGRGRVILKLNDHCQLDSEGTFHSRLVARTQGNLRLVLNTKLWPEMVIEKASERAIRVSAMEDGNIQLYLIMAAVKDASQLYTAIDSRIQTLKRNQSPNQKHSEETAESTENSCEGEKGDDDDKEKGENEDISNEDTQASSV